MTVLLWPYLPASTERLLAALGAPDALARRRRRFGAGAIERGRARSEPLFPKDAAGAARRRCVIDSHTHLDLCEPPDAELVAAAEAAGVRRMLTVGIDGASCRAALAAAEDFPQVYAAIGRHPNSRPRLRRRRPRRAARRSPRTSAAWRSARRASTSTATTPRRADQERAFAAQIALARETGKPLVIHTRAADEDTLDQLARRSARACSVVMHCFSMPERLEECLERGYAISFAGNVTYKSAADLARGGAGRCPTSGCWSRPTPPT